MSRLGSDRAEDRVARQSPQGFHSLSFHSPVCSWADSVRAAQPRSMVSAGAGRPIA
jgi:hypothetical protein